MRSSTARFESLDAESAAKAPKLVQMGERDFRHRCHPGLEPSEGAWK